MKKKPIAFEIISECCNAIAEVIDASFKGVDYKLKEYRCTQCGLKCAVRKEWPKKKYAKGT